MVERSPIDVYSASVLGAARPDQGTHAVVVGGSMAGLLAARVLADHFDRVTVLDRDTFPDQPDHRAGAPQSRHAHALLARGLAVIEDLFPGLSAELVDHGAFVADADASFAFVTPAGRLPATPGGRFLGVSRILLEWTVRGRLAAHPAVALVTGRDVVGLTATNDGARVTGVRWRSRGGDEIGRMAADLVVDASGRNSAVPVWLRLLGHEAPPEETINSGLGYASRFYERPAGWPVEWEGIVVNGRPPHNPRAGLILPIEHRRWHVSLGGFAGHHPPTDEAGFLEWARQLPDPAVYEAIRVARPLTPIRGYRTPTNRRRRFERLQRQPAGFVAVGDAVCAFNPIYGQGMSVAALGAHDLGAALAEQRRRPRPGFERRFQARLARTVADPWFVATGEDLRWAGVRLDGAPPRPGAGLLRRYSDHFLRQATTDVELAGVYLAMINLIVPPRALASPAVAWRLLRRSLTTIGRQVPAAPTLSPEALARLRDLDGTGAFAAD